MAFAPPVSAPLPVAAVVAPTPVSKHQRGQHTADADTPEAVDPAETAEHLRRPRRRAGADRGQLVDILV